VAEAACALLVVVGAGSQRQGSQELRRHQPDHPQIRQAQNRPGPVRAQRPAPRRPRRPGLHRLESLPPSTGASEKSLPGPATTDPTPAPASPAIRPPRRSRHPRQAPTRSRRQAPFA
jgi:hypothetical protein